MRRIDIGIPVHNPVTDKFRMSQTGNHAEYAFLLSPFQMRLEPNDIVHRIMLIILPKLYDGIRILSRPRIRQSYRLHRPKPHRVFSPLRHDLNRHASFEDFFIFKSVNRSHLCSAQCSPECLIFLFIHGAVQIGRFPLIVTGHTVNH